MSTARSPITLEPRAVRGFGTVLVAAVLFGAMAVFVRLACREMPSGQVAFVRFAGSLAVLLLLTRGRGLRPRPGQLGRVLLRGLLGAGSIALYYRAIHDSGAGLATLVYGVYPVWTALFAGLVVGERADGRLGLALGLSAVGLAVVLGPGLAVRDAALTGALPAVVASVLAGGAVATARQLRLTETSVLVTTHFMAVGAAVTLPLLAVGPALRPSPALLGVLVGVVLTSLGGQLLLHEGLGFMSATEGSLAAATSVGVAAALQVVWLGEHLSGHAVLGAGLLFGAVAVAAGAGPVRVDSP